MKRILSLILAAFLLIAAGIMAPALAHDSDDLEWGFSVIVEIDSGASLDSDSDSDSDSHSHSHSHWVFDSDSDSDSDSD